MAQGRQSIHFRKLKTPTIPILNITENTFLQFQKLTRSPPTFQLIPSPLCYVNTFKITVKIDKRQNIKQTIMHTSFWSVDSVTGLVLISFNASVLMVFGQYVKYICLTQLPRIFPYVNTQTYHFGNISWNQSEKERSK